MIDKVIWSPEAETDLSIILDYLMSQWDVSVSSNFLDKIEHHIKRISDNPNLYPVIYDKQQFRKCVITKQNTLVYFYKKRHLYILRIFDTRQHPNKLKLK